MYSNRNTKCGICHTTSLTLRCNRCRRRCSELDLWEADRALWLVLQAIPVSDRSPSWHVQYEAIRGDRFTTAK